MKRPSLIQSIELLLFFVLLAGALFVFFPLSKQLEKGLSLVRDNLVQKLESSTGLHFSYKALSPSILSSLKLTDLVITDAVDGTVFARVSEVSVSYNIFALIRGDIHNTVTEIVIQNGSISVDYTRNQTLISLLQSLGKESNSPEPVVKEEKVEKPVTKEETSDGTENTPESVNLLTVKIKNIDIQYTDATQKLAIHVRKGLAQLESDIISFELDSDIQFNRFEMTDIGLLKAGINFKGSINNTFDSGSATLVIKNLTGRQFSITRLALITSFRDGIVSVSSVQDLQPVDIKVLWDTAKNDISGSLVCENLLPFRFVRFTDENSVFAKLKDTVLTGEATITSTVTDGLLYSLAMKASLPTSFMGGADVVLDCSGSSTNVDLKSIKINGSNYDISFSGSIDLLKMIPEGFLSVKKLSLPSGNTFVGDMYIQKLNSGFTCLVPEFMLDTNVFSSISIDVTHGKQALDFTLSAFDKSGHIQIDGSLLYGKEVFLQIYGAFDSISASNTAGTILSIVLPHEKKTNKNLKKLFDPYALTTEVYFSTNLTNVSFSCTRLVLASTKKDGLYALLSVKGNETGIDITDIDFSPGIFDVSGNVHIGIEESQDVLLDFALTVNSIPYFVSGIYSKNVLSLYGDYNVAASVFFDPLGDITGSFSLDEFPLSTPPLMLSLALDGNFTLGEDSAWDIKLNSGTLQEMSGHFPLATVVDFQGLVNNSGVFFEKLTIADQASQISGFAGFSVIPGTGNDTRFSAEASLQSIDSTEKYKAKGELTISDDLYFQSEVQITESPLMRYIRGQKPQDRISFDFSCSGTPSTVFASATVSKLLYNVGGFDLYAHGKVLMEDQTMSLFDAGASWNGHTFTGLKGTASMKNMKATLESSYEGVFGQSGLSAGINVSFNPDIKEGLPSLDKLLDRFSITTTVSDIKWNSIVSSEPITCTFSHEPGVTALYAGKNDAVTGYLLDDGTFSLQAGTVSPVSFSANGTLLNTEISLDVKNFHTDLNTIWPYTGISLVKFDDGSVDGDFTISGLLNDPEFHGVLHATDIVLSAPGFVTDPYGPFSCEVLADGKTITIPAFTASGKYGAVSAAAVLEFDRWVPSNISVKTATLPGSFIKLDTDNNLITASGFSTYDFELLINQDGIDISGNASFERGTFAIKLPDSNSNANSSPSVSNNASNNANNNANSNANANTSQASNQIAPQGNSSIFNIKLDVDFNLGKKVEFRYPTVTIPIIRGLIQSDKPFKMLLDTANNTFQFKGEANLKGGEIFYFKRSFYLKSGTITFNENQDSFDPFLSFRAEIRERDADGEPIRIILSVDHQTLSTFRPLLTSDPMKTNSEIMVLLGAIVSADTTRETLVKDILVNSSDILTQIGIFRGVENNIRDVFNLDIFSIRTMILQNAIIGPAMQSSTESEMTIGNYFDNTTVYMGKYLGSAIYADALLHFSYYDPKSAQNLGTEQNFYGNLLFQPEIGVEMATPFFLLRWAIAPSDLSTLFVADNSITLSWKFSY